MPRDIQMALQKAREANKELAAQQAAIVAHQRRAREIMDLHGVDRAAAEELAAQYPEGDLPAPLTTRNYENRSQTRWWPEEEVQRGFGGYQTMPAKDVNNARVSMIVQASAEGFPNPYHGNPEFGGDPDFSHTWFHGTKGAPQFGERRGHGDFAERLGLPPDERMKGSGWPQPNQMMGIHLSPLHEVAHKFAWGSQPSAIVHAKLNFSNPVHYPTERHLDYAVADWASKNFPEWHNDQLNRHRSWNYSDNDGTYADFSQVPEGYGNKAQDVLQWHPYLPEIIKGFHQHLAEQGHHGITYGNMVEGPYISDIITGGRRRPEGEPYPQANWPWGVPHSISAIAQPRDIQITGMEHIAASQATPEPGQVTWDQASRLDEPEEMRDRVLDFHRQNGGAYPQRSMHHEASWEDVAEFWHVAATFYPWDEDEPVDYQYERTPEGSPIEPSPAVDLAKLEGLGWHTTRWGNAARTDENGVEHTLYPMWKQNRGRRYWDLSSRSPYGTEQNFYRSPEEAHAGANEVSSRLATDPVLGERGVAGLQHRKTVDYVPSTRDLFDRLSANSESPLTWDEIGERHPQIYGDSEVHGEQADEGDGNGIGWAASQLAFERPGHSEPDEGSYDLDFHLKDVPVSQIDYARHGAGDPRVRSARSWYRDTPDEVVPPVLVHRHGVYQVADGHHRGEAAALEGKETIPAYVAQSPYEDEPFADGSRGPFHGAEPMQYEASAKKKPKPKKPRKPEEVWYDVHKHPDGVPGGMGKSPEHHLRNRGWMGHEIHGASSKTIQYRNHQFPDFVISYGGASSTKPDHNFRVLYIGSNHNVPKVTRSYSVAEAMNKVEELHQLQSGLVVMPMTHGAATDMEQPPEMFDPEAEMPQAHRDWLEARDWKPRTEPEDGRETFAPHYTKMTPSGIKHSLFWDGKRAWQRGAPVYQIESSVPDKHTSWRSLAPAGENPVFESSDLGEIMRRAKDNERAFMLGGHDKPYHPGLMRFMQPDMAEYDQRFWDEPPAEGPVSDWTEFGRFREPQEKLHPNWRTQQVSPQGRSGMGKLNSTAVPHTVNNPPVIKDPRQFLAPNQPKKPPVTAPTYPIGPKPVKEFTDQPEPEETEVQENKPQLNQIPETPGPTQKSQFKWHSSVADSWEDHGSDPVFENVVDPRHTGGYVY